ncbi:arsenate reductase ArsC [bacterium]|nr:arsenate reductase ArsC [bacterium]
MSENPNKIKLLFLCTGNSCRSQMAEGWTRHLKRDWIDVWSAGVEPHGLNPYTVQVMAEAGVDISDYRSKHINDVMDIPFDYVVTVCDHARESCPLFPRPVKKIHKSFDDPPTLAKQAASEEEKIEIYRRVRDKIRAFIETLPEELK